jgi:cobalt-zinc-cadmium efflux system outer membrane protein
MPLLNLRAICACLLFTLSAIVPATGADSGDAPPLTLERAVAAALKTNPELRSFAFELRALNARLRQADLRPAPSISVQLENALGTGETSGFKSAEMTLALSQVIELGGKRDARRNAAQAARSSADIDQQARQLDVLADVTRRVIAVVAQQERLRLAGVARSLAEQTVAGSDRRVQAAKSPHVELDRARISLDHATLAERRAVADLQAARQQLAATWGESTPTLEGQGFGQVRADLFAVPTVGDFAALTARLNANPDFQRFNSEARLRDAQLRLAATLRKPDLSLSGGVRRLQGTRDQALVLSVSVPLFAGRRAESFVDEARARREQVDSQRQAARTRVEATLYELHQALQQAVLEAHALQKDMMPRAQEALQETQYAYDRGRYSYLELIDAQHEFLAIQSDLIDAATNAHQLRAEIERLTGEPLAPTATNQETP